MSWKSKLVIEDYVIHFPGLHDAVLESHLLVLEFAVGHHGSRERRRKGRKKMFASLESSCECYCAVKT